jgi:hypothetical protein
MVLESVVMAFLVGACLRAFVEIPQAQPVRADDDASL